MLRVYVLRVAFLPLPEKINMVCNSIMLSAGTETVASDVRKNVVCTMYIYDVA